MPIMHITERLQDALDLCRKNNCTKVFFDASNTKGRLTTFERFDLGLKAAMVFRSEIKLAVLYRAADINQFAETVGVNRGLNVRIFSERSKALEWLGITED